MDTGAIGGGMESPRPFLVPLRKFLWGLRDGGSVVKSTGFSSGGPGFESRHLRGSSQVYGILIRGVPCPRLTSAGTERSTWRANAQTRKMKAKKKKKL